MAQRIIPKNAREAYAILDKKLSKKDKAALLDADDSIDFHYGLGMWIRNSWIYPKNGIASEQNGWMKDELFCMPDDISDKIIKGYIRHLKYLQNKQ